MVTDATFEAEVLKSDIPVLVDFWAPWCGPCRMIAPLIDQLAEEYSGKLKAVSCPNFAIPSIFANCDTFNSARCASTSRCPTHFAVFVNEFLRYPRARKSSDFDSESRHHLWEDSEAFHILTDQSENHNQVKLNTDESPSVATEYGIRSIPTVMIFKGGQKLDTVIGAVPKSTLTGTIEKYL